MLYQDNYRYIDCNALSRYRFSHYCTALKYIYCTYVHCASCMYIHFMQGSSYCMEDIAIAANTSYNLATYVVTAPYLFLILIL